MILKERIVIDTLKTQLKLFVKLKKLRHNSAVFISG